MALVYVGGASASGTAASFSVSLTGLTGGAGSAAQTGDLVIVATGFAASSNGNPGVETAGYTEVADLYANASRDSNFAVAYKVLSSAETSVTCSGSGIASNAAATVVHVWRGASASTPMDVAATTAVSSGRVINNPAITPVTVGAEIVIAGMATATAAFNSTTAPSGFGNQVYISHDPGTAIGMGMASAPWSGSGTVDPDIWTATGNNASDSWAAVTLALRPAGATAVDRSAASAGASSAVAASRYIVRVRGAGAGALSMATAGRYVARNRAAGVLSASTVAGSGVRSLSRPASVTASGAATAARAVSRNRSASAAASSAVTASGGVFHSVSRSAVVNASGVATAGRSIILPRHLDVASAAAATAEAVVVRHRSAASGAVSSLSVVYELAGLVVRSAAVAAGSAAEALPALTFRRSVAVHAETGLLASRYVVTVGRADVSSVSTATAVAFTGAVHRRYAYPSDARGGIIIAGTRGGQIVNEPRGGRIQRA